jgi:hypothetical protein
MSTVATKGWALGLTAIFLASLPFVNPWVRGDGVGYYAYVRSLLIQHDLNFEQDWLHGNSSFVAGRVDNQGHILSNQYTATGHLDNHFSIGPALLWSPFLLLTHGFVIGAKSVGYDVPADGFSRPYRITMAISTSIYGFVGLLCAFDLARQYYGGAWSFLSTVAIWFGSSFPVYAYFNPSWSHAHSVFAVSLFLWYWHRTREEKGWARWAIVGALASLMVTVYYINAVFLLVLAPEAIAHGELTLSRLQQHALLALVFIISLLPTFITRSIIYGSPFESGYPPLNTWSWTSPRFLQVLFSADHGLLTWTPILVPALAGLVLFWRKSPWFGGGLLLSFMAYLYCIASYVDWDGLSSFGNRFFVSCTPLFVIGLAAFLQSVAHKIENSAYYWGLVGCVVLLVLWNLGFAFQWGMQIVPAHGPVSWGEVIGNQFVAVPKQLRAGLHSYFTKRAVMMQEIELKERSRD